MKRLVSSIAAVVFVLGLAASMGCGSSSGNPAKGALDSLPNAPLNQTTAKQAASMASTAAVGATEVPKASDYAGTGALPTLPLAVVAASNLPLQQKTALAAALNHLRTQAVTGTCPVITDNSTFPTGNVVDVTVDAGAGCTTTGGTISGKMTVKGTIDAATGTVNVTMTVSSYAMTVTCSPGSLSITMNGSGTVTATGLTDASSAFSVKEVVDVNIGFSGTCGGQSASGSGFVYLDTKLDGSKAGNTWTFTGANSEGTEISAGGAKVGAYGSWTGTITIDTKGTASGFDDTGTIVLNGTVGWNNPVYGGAGKVSVDYNASFNHSVCFDEPISGTLQVSSGSDKVVMTFDGATNLCGCAPWTLNGAAGVPSPLCW